jgi:hypothetical protein
VQSRFEKKPLSAAKQEPAKSLGYKTQFLSISETAPGCSMGLMQKFSLQLKQKWLSCFTQNWKGMYSMISCRDFFAGLGSIITSAGFGILSYNFYNTAVDSTIAKTAATCLQKTGSGLAFGLFCCDG